MIKEHEEKECQQENERLRLTEAYILARRGRHAEALERLADAYSHAECTEAEALDLKARICAQQGLLLQAEACWRKAQSLDADNPAYSDALTALRQSQRPFAAWRQSGVWVGTAALMVVLIGMLVAGHRSADRDRLALTRRLLVLEGMIHVLSGHMDQASESTARAIAPLAKTADVDAAARQASADFQKEMEHRQQEWNARLDRTRDALDLAITESENRIKAENVRQNEITRAKWTQGQNQLGERISMTAEGLTQVVGVSEARMRVRQEGLDATLMKIQEALKTLETAQAEYRRRQQSTWSEWTP